eukprot:gene9378-12636_t
MLQKWLVIGAGPCGIASVGRLVDIFGSNQVLWIDPSFSCGRMGKYRNVPANTTTEDLISAFALCDSFKFQQNQISRRRKKDELVLSDLNGKECAKLGYFLDAIEDATEELKKSVQCIQGNVQELHKTGKQEWLVSIRLQSEATDDTKIIHFLCNFVIFASGGEPIFPVLTNSLFNCNNKIVPTVHHLDSLVDPIYCQNLANSNKNTDISKWAVFGGSHTAMLILKNLEESGFKNIVNFYRSELRFMHTTIGGWQKYVGTGLKGPVGNWAKKFTLLEHDSIIKRIKITDEMSFEEYLQLYDITDCVFALGFQTICNTPITPTIISNGNILENDILLKYDKITGEIDIPFEGNENNTHYSSGLFGIGIAFPQDILIEDNTREPYVGFKRSILQTDLIIEKALSST